MNTGSLRRNNLAARYLLFLRSVFVFQARFFDHISPTAPDPSANLVQRFSASTALCCEPVKPGRC
jgi:hypothetical protein